ncbi:MAG TPA: PAS domain S-box protein [Candidatus Acidoferrum sp.]|nr:PAS domain S-box protein [Candidatus Acidoferrum sp.]
MTIASATELIRKWTSSLWRRVVLFGAGFFLCAELGIFLSPERGRYLSFWLPAGLSLAVLLLSPTRNWKWFLLAIIPANWLFDYLFRTPFPMIVCFWAANIVGAFTGAWMVRTFVADCPRLKTLNEFVGLIFFGAALNSTLSATIGAAALAHYGLSPSFSLSWRVLVGSDLMAILILTTFILTWFSPSNGWRERFNSRGKIVEAVLLFAGLSASVWYLFAWDKGVLSPNKSIAIPFLLWAGLRFGTHGATAACLYLSLLLSFLSAQTFYHLPPGFVSPGTYALVLQTVLATAVMVSLIPAIVLSERDRAMARLRESEERYRNLTQAAFEGVIITENGRILDMNEQMLKMFGYERNEMIDRPIVDVVAPESRSIAAECIRTGREEAHELQLLRKDGGFFVAETRSRMLHAGGHALRMTALQDITARKRAEQALRESEEKFSKAFRTSPDVMSITDFETGRYLEVNGAHEKTFGFKRDEVVGRSPTELGILPDPEIREKMIRILKEHGRFNNCESKALSRDGRVLTLLLSAELIELGGRMCVLRVTHDITDRKRAEEALRESEQRFRSYFELASVGFAITSSEMKLLAINDEYCRIMGYPREELLRKNWAELTYPEDLKSNTVVFQEALAGKIDAYTINKRVIRKDGQLIHVTISARCVRRPDGTPDYFVSLLLDITEREQAIEREARGRAEYTLQLIASQEAERARIAGELHDSLGQSLSIIKNHAQLLLLEKRMAATIRKGIETISEATTAAIAEMRRISQDLHPHQLDHLGLTRALDALVDNAGSASSITFKKKFDMVDDTFLRDKAASVYRIVQEGLNNILKYSEAKTATITLERDLHEVRLLIEDGGKGFNPDDISKGMGLKNIAERTRILGGRLKLNAAPGEGVRIEITIPISAGQE